MSSNNKPQKRHYYVKSTAYSPSFYPSLSSSPNLHPTPSSSPSSPSLNSSSILSSIKDGFGLGVGSSVANRLVDSVFGPRQITVNNCDVTIKTYNEYIKTGTVPTNIEQQYNECIKK